MWTLLQLTQEQFRQFSSDLSGLIWPENSVVLSHVNSTGSTSHDVYISPGGLNWLISIDSKFSQFGMGRDVPMPEDIGGYTGPGRLDGDIQYYKSIRCPKEDGETPAAPVY